MGGKMSTCVGIFNIKKGDNTGDKGWCSISEHVLLSRDLLPKKIEFLKNGLEQRFLFLEP